MFYQLIIIGANQAPLTYHSQFELKKGDIVKVSVKSSQKEAMVWQKCDKPSFDCKDILEQTSFFYSDTQIKLADFIYKYYASSLGESIKLFMPFSHENVF